MQGVTAGDGKVGLGISPLSIYDSKKIFIYNSLQVIFGIKKMPTYFFIGEKSITNLLTFFGLVYQTEFILTMRVAKTFHSVRKFHSPTKIFF
jgi:hypothetical protein